MHTEYTHATGIRSIESVSQLHLMHHVQAIKGFMVFELVLTFIISGNFKR
jgi:hypothetical protein